LAGLANLQLLYLYHNQLSGSVPTALAGLLSLESLDLSGNSLTGGIPPELGDLPALEYLNLSVNHLDGGIPPELETLSSLRNLVLYGNRLGGSIPPQLGSLANLRYLSLDSNQLGGDVPPALAGLGLYVLDLGYNKLTASDPALIAYLDAQDPDWADTQTVPPADVQVTLTGTHSIDLSWTPIPYTAHGGYYEVGVSTVDGGPYTVHGVTADKTATGHVVDNLDPDTPYYFVVRTHTPAHEHELQWYDQQNDLWSEYSVQVSARTDPLALIEVTRIIEAGDAPPATFDETGVTLDCASGPGGTVTVTLQPFGYPSPPDSVGVLSTYWEISSTFDAPFVCDLVFSYDEGYLDGAAEVDLAGAARWDAANQQWDYFGGEVDADANTVTIAGMTAFSPWLLLTLAPPQAVFGLSGTQAGSNVELTWPAVTEDLLGNPITPDHYVVYRRADEPYFIPTPADIVAAPTTSGWTDMGILGDPATNYYYIITAVDGAGTESAPSIRLGAVDQALTPAASPGERAYNLVAVNLDLPSVVDADSLASTIGPGAYMVLRHDAATQHLEWRLPSLAGTNFAVSVGDAVFLTLDDSAPALVSLVGEVPPIGAVSAKLTAGAPGSSCAYNFISVPLHRDDLADADALAADIGGVYSVSRYDAATQSIEWRLPGVSGPNFPVRAGHPYIVCLDEAAPASWP
jgi:hypothetical protein